MKTNLIVGWIIAILAITPSEEPLSYQGEPPQFEIKEFEYVFNKLQELIDEVKALKEVTLPQTLTTDEWQELLFPLDEQIEAQENTPLSIGLEKDHSFPEFSR